MKEKIFKYLYIALILIFLVSLWQTKNIPTKEKIDPLLLKEPVQKSTERKPFLFNYRGKDYHVEPVADYELWGLVVSVNNIDAWFNYYHDENTVNLKDVCVIWGDNITSEAYLEPKTKFKSGEWTCYVRWWTKEGEINMHQLSNNHLLSADENIQKQIASANIGDQIHLKGSLVDYAEVGKGWYRKTSISRTDSNQTSRSGGACEVFYVDEMEYVSKNQKYWHLAKDWSKYIFVLFLITNFVAFILSIFSKDSLFKNNKKND